jgi:hypothetical protein
MNDRQIRGAIDGLFKQRQSPLEGYGAYFWVLGRFHGIDGRLAVGIAGAETSFATDPHMTPADLPGHNAWGFGHPPGATHGHQFACWEDGIAAVTQFLAEDYVAKGFDTVAKMASRWVGGPAPIWIKNVTAIMQQLGGDPNKLTCPNLATFP